MDANQMDQIMKDTPQTVKRAAMSAYDAIMAKGREEGLKAGIEKGREAQNRRLVNTLILQTDFDDAKIAQLTGVAEQYVRDARIELERGGLAAFT